MEFLLTDARLERCNPMGFSPYCATMYSELLDSYVMVGDFISVCLPEGEKVIGRLIDVSLLDNIPISEVGTRDSDYFFLDNGTEKKVCGLIHIWKRVNNNNPGYERPAQSVAYTLSGVKEMVESWSAMWFGSFSLENIVFIMHASEFTSGNISSLNGIENLFFARYQQKEGANYSVLAPFQSFKSTHGYSYRVFSSLQHVRREIDRLFFRVGMSQGDRGYISTYLPHDCWKYFYAFFVQDVHIKTQQVTRRLCTKRSTYDLTQQKVRIARVLELAEVNTQQSLSSLALLFGKSIGIGVRKRFPRVGEEGVSMGVGDNINLLAPKPTNKNKIGFRYDKGMSKLNVTVRYSNFAVTNSESFYNCLIGLPQGELIRANNIVSPEQAEQLAEEESTADIVDCQLMVSNRRYRVQSVHNGTARIVAEDGSRSSLHLPEDDANELVDELNL